MKSRTDWWLEFYRNAPSDKLRQKLAALHRRADRREVEADEDHREELALRKLLAERDIAEGVIHEAIPGVEY